MKWLGLTPFALYVLIFLGVPSVLAIGTGFFGADGQFTLDNFATLTDPIVIGSFWSSIWISALTAGVGAILGGLLSFVPRDLRRDVRARTDAVGRLRR